MADYYTQLSFVVKCTPEDRDSLLEMVEAENEKREEVGDCSLGANFDVDEEGVWIHDEDGYVEVEGVADVLQQWLILTDETDLPIAFEWANTCSKPRLDAFGGGAALIRKEGVEFLSTSSWIDDKVSSQ